jgi:hypothetical protein
MHADSGRIVGKAEVIQSPNKSCGFRSCEKFIGRNDLESLPKGRGTALRQLLVTITVVLAVTFPALAQTTVAPDFSGTWVLSAAKSTLPKDRTIKSQTIVIDNKKSAILFHYNTDGTKLTLTYKPDGKKRVSAERSSGQLISSARWHDSVLVIESTLYIKLPYSVTVVPSGLKPVIDTWTLATDGRTLTQEAADHKEIYVYEKQ